MTSTIPVTGFDLDKSSVTGTVGGADTVVTVSNIQPSEATNKKFSATSDNPNVATVTSSDGIHFNIHRVATGATTVNIKSDDSSVTKAVSVTVS